MIPSFMLEVIGIIPFLDNCYSFTDFYTNLSLLNIYGKLNLYYLKIKVNEVCPYLDRIYNDFLICFSIFMEYELKNLGVTYD